MCLTALCTVLLPHVVLAVDKAFDTSKVSISSLNQADSRKVVQYLATPATKPADQLKSGTEATLLPGHAVKVEATTRYAYHDS